MKIDSNLLNEFAKITNDKDNKETPKNIYGIIVKNGDETYVRLDGSEDGCLTPVTMTMDADDGDAVLCKIENHTVTVVGNVEHPAQSLKSSSAYNTIEEIVGGMAITSKGVKVFYQENEPEGTAEYPLNPGDTWYKLDPDTGLAITIFIYTKDLIWKETALTINAANVTGKLTANQIDASKLEVNAANVTGKLTANQIDASKLEVNAANVTGKLTANQIDASGLKVNAANVTGKLTANQIDASELEVNAANVTGKLTANQIDASGLEVNAANVTGKLTANQIDASGLEVNAANVTGKLTANQIDASELVVEDANIKSINGNKIKDGTIIAAALSHEAILTASGVKVYYQPVEPQRTLISSVVNGATTSWYEDTEGHIMRDGDTWYKTVKMANDPKDYCQIVYVYNSSTNQFKETPLDAAVLRENSITAREIDVNELAANEAFINRLKVNAANVTGKLTANQIDASELEVNAANVTGKLTANQIDASELEVNAANVTGKLTANQIDASKLEVNAANVTGKLTANQIDASELEVNAANVTGKLTANQIDASGLKVNAANVTGKLTANQIDTGSLTAENVLVEDSNGNVIFDANSSNHTVKIGDITVTTDLLDTLTKAIRLATGKALVVDAANLTIDANGTITATNGSFTGKVTATSGSFTGKVTATSGKFTGSIEAGSTISGSMIVTNGRTAIDNNITGLYANTDGFDYCFAESDPQTDITTTNIYHHIRFSSSGISIDDILNYKGLVLIGGTRVRALHLNNYMLCKQGVKQFVNSSGNNILAAAMSRKSVTADNISISANSYKNGTVTITPSSGYEVYAVGGFALSNASSGGTGSSNCAVSTCNINSIGASSSTIAYQINTWSSSAVKVKLIIMCLQRPKSEVL